MKKIKITESDLKIASASEVKKIFAEAGKSKEGKKTYADEMELFYFMEKIQQELKRRHISRYAFAKNAGMNPFVLSRAMTNIEDAKYKTLKKMANGLGKGLRLELYDLPKHT